MATNVIEFLEQRNWDTPFQPYVEMNREADALTFYFKPDADYSERLTDHVTLYRSLESNELVGCRIKGIAGILEDLPNFLHVDHQGARLSMVFWSFRGGLDEVARDAFKQLAEAAGDRTLQPA
jgi:hypothetical protein